MNRLHHALTVPDRWMKCLVGYLPSAIKIATGQTAPVVTVDNTVWVEHWHDLEDKVLPQHPRLVVIRVGKEGEHTSHHPRAYSFPRVHARRDDYALALAEVL